VRILIALLLGVAVTPAVAGAEADDASAEGAVLTRRALEAVAFDPWLLQDDEIDPRRADIVAYEVFTNAAAVRTAAAVAETEAELLTAEGVLADAVDHRADMELEVEGFSIEIWFLGDLGLQETFDSEAERARQFEPVVAATEALISRVEEADAAIVVAEAEIAEIEVVLAERVAADEAARKLLRDATQIRERFESMVTDRNEAIERWSHEALESESSDISFATITSVVVQMPVEVPATPAVDGAELAQGELPVDTGAQGTQEPASVPTRATTVSVAPIMVNAAIAGQVQALIGAARSDGIDLHGGGYRPVADQITLRIAHCGTSGYDIFEKPAGECQPPTARPGFSQHELGLAIDFTENGAIVTPGSPAFNWLVANAGSFGLINLPSEAWHWSTTGG
jgi:hypothetical protein